MSISQQYTCEQEQIEIFLGETCWLIQWDLCNVSQSLMAKSGFKSCAWGLWKKVRRG